MTNQNIKQGVLSGGVVVRKAFQVAKFSVVAAIVFTSLVGAYVLYHADLRNQTIDFAQGQTQVEAEAPKAN